MKPKVKERGHALEQCQFSAKINLAKTHNLMGFRVGTLLYSGTRNIHIIQPNAPEWMQLHLNLQVKAAYTHVHTFAPMYVDK